MFIIANNLVCATLVRSPAERQQKGGSVIAAFEARKGYAFGIGGFDSAELLSECRQPARLRDGHELVRGITTVVANQRKESIARQKDDRSRLGGKLCLI